MTHTFKTMILAASVFMVSATAQAQSSGQTYSVELNKTEVVQLPSSASAVVVGNPDIADVSVHSDRTVFVVGRGFGETNMVILDSIGAVIMNANVQVTNPLPAHGVRIYNGTSDRRTYSCTPFCLPAPVLGDSSTFINGNSTDATPIINDVANRSSGGAGSGFAGAGGN